MSIKKDLDLDSEPKDNVYLDYLRDSDEFRIAMANWYAYRSEVDTAFAEWVLKWLLQQKRNKEQS